MTVRELMERLAQMDQDAVVRYPDTYEAAEGWGEYDPFCVVSRIAVADGTVTLYGELEDEDEDEEDDD